jgi:hypothetical protein
MLRAKGFSCSLDVLFGGLRMCKLKFLIIKSRNFFPAVKFYKNRSSKSWIRIQVRLDLKHRFLCNLLSSGGGLGPCGRESPALPLPGQAHQERDRGQAVTKHEVSASAPPLPQADGRGKNKPVFSRAKFELGPPSRVYNASQKICFLL